MNSSNARKLSRQKFHNELSCVFTAPCTSKNADWNQQQWRHFGQSEQCKSSVLFPYPIRKKSRFCLFCMWSVKGLYHALLPKTDYRDKGRGPDRRLDVALTFEHFRSYLKGDNFTLLQCFPKGFWEGQGVFWLWFSTVFVWCLNNNRDSKIWSPVIQG